MKDYPIIKVALLFIIGIICQKLFQLDLFFISILFASLFSLAVLSALIIPKILIKNLIIFLCLITAGGAYYGIFKPEVDPALNRVQKLKDFSAFGTVSKIDLHREYEIRFEVRTDSIKISNKIFKKDVNLLCRIRYDKKELDSIYALFFPGNIIEINGTYSKGREQRNPGEFDYNKYLTSNGITGTLTSYNLDEFKILNNKRDEFKSSVFSIRKTIDNLITKIHQPKTASLLKGLLLADRSEIDYETRTEFVNSGVVHVLAVSGLHTGFIILIFLFLFGRFNIYLRSILTITGLIFFLILTGMPPSVFRATIMAVVIIAAFVTGRSTNIYNSLALAAFVLLLVNPAELFNPGFQLSFSAVFAIAVLYPYFSKWIYALNIKNIFIKYILLFLAVSLCAQLGTIPFTIYYFEKLSVVSLAANLVVIPAIGCIVGIGILTLVLYPIFAPLSLIYASANDLLSLGLFKLVKYFGTLEFSFLPIKMFTIYDAILFYLAGALVVFIIANAYKKSVKIIAIILITANFLILSSLDNKNIFEENKLSVIAVDVGQGDAVLIKFPNGKTALIDAGDANPFFDNGERVIIPLLDHLKIKKIDYGFISHLDADHYGGFVSLILDDRISKIIKPPFDSSLSKDVKLEKFLNEFNIPIEYYSKRRMNIGNVSLYFLNDGNNDIYKRFSSNNKSGIIKLVYGETSFLFTGDVEKEGEAFYVKNFPQFLESDVLKVAHHGSATSTTPNFIILASPEISIISAGILNKFGHPSDIILNRLKAVNSTIYRTDSEGAILLQSDGNNIHKINWREFY